MRIVIIGQSLFASSVYSLLKEQGKEIVGVFTIPDIDGREDPLASIASANNVPVFKVKRWRIKGKIIDSLFDSYKSLKPQLNILPYCTQYIPIEIINYPEYASICYHPSLLPRHRGASSINWTLIQGDQKSGYTIFWPDDGLDTGPILYQKFVDVDENDTVESLYNRFMFPEGVIGIAESVNLIENQKAPKIQQYEGHATYEPILNKEELSKISFDLNARELHNFIRGMDKVPGAWLLLDDKKVKVFSSKLYNGPLIGKEVKIEGMDRPGLINKNGLILFAKDGKSVIVSKLMIDSKMILASKYGQGDIISQIEHTPSEKSQIEVILKIWSNILRIDVLPNTDFFASGAGSMDVTRLVEEVRQKCDIIIANEDVYMATTFEEFSNTCILKSRNGSNVLLKFKPIILCENNMKISIPNQLFINNEFVNSSDGSTLTTINPTNEEVICLVQCATPADVDKAVLAAEEAFKGEWGTMSARERGVLMNRLADLMEENKEEFATIESLDSGAIYTLALKTHIGMSIDTFRYFAGWCDKIEGSTIPITHARPNRNLTFTKREPLGVCGIITPWNYPLMMLAWKTAACLAAGNTCIIKPAQVCPLTSLKFAQLVALAGFPPGVVNVLPGSGKVIGKCITEHPGITKVGFTGSTLIGKEIMKSCSKSVKRVSLELGGKSPLIIFDDCDLTKAVRFALSAVFFNKGENCIAAGRIFVQDNIYEEFIRRVVRNTSKIVIGNPLDRSTNHGPQNHKAHLDKLVEYCKIGIKEGAKCIYGGEALPIKGYFFKPTIFIDVTDDMYIAKEESFGPIMIISRFWTTNEVISRANNTEYGLASGVFTKDLSKALNVSEKIHAGTCFINCYNKTDVASPFGGFKKSGFGKDLGQEALNEYLRTKTITIEY